MAHDLQDPSSLLKGDVFAPRGGQRAGNKNQRQEMREKGKGTRERGQEHLSQRWEAQNGFWIERRRT